MARTYAWKGGSGSLSLAADWINTGNGQTALAAPGTADTALLTGAASGLLLVTGALDVAALVASLGVALGGDVTTGTLAAAGTLVLDPAATLDAAAATIAGVLAVVGAGAAARVTGTLALGGAASATGGGAVSAGALVLAGGTLSVDALSAAAIGGGTAAAGAIAVRAGAAITGSGAVDADAGGIALAGTVAAAGGALSLFGTVAGTGTLAIGAGATLFAADAVGAGLTAVFAAPTGGVGGTLELFGPGASFGATIAGFVPGDAIEIASDAIEAAVWNKGVLTLTDTAGTTLALALPDAGGLTYDTGLFLPLPDGVGGTDVLLAPGTIAAPQGNLTYTVPAGAFQFIAAGAAVTQVVVAGTLVAQHLGANAVTVTGTMIAGGVGAAAISCPTATVSGLEIAIGTRATVSVKNGLQLSGTLAAAAGGLATAGTVTLAGGALTLDPASFMTIGGASAEIGRIALAAGATLAGFGRIDGSLDDAGVLVVQGGLLRLDAPASGVGAVRIGSGGTLAEFGALALPVAFAANATLQVIGGASLITGTLSGFAAGDALDFADASIAGAAWAGGTLSLSAGGTVAATLALAGAYGGKTWQTASDGAGGTLVTLGSGGGQPLTIAGTLAVATAIAAPSATGEAGSVIEMQGGTLAVGTLQLLAGASLAGAGAIDGALVTAGGVTASGGALVVAGPIVGAGTVAIAATGALFAEAGFAGATPVTFLGVGGTLALFGRAGAMPGPIGGFAHGDGLDLLAADVTGATWAATGGGLGTLDLIGPAGDLGSFSLIGNYAGDSFVAYPDGGGGSLVSLTGGAGGGADAPVPCFLAGTRIATPAGACPVEALRPGDWVVTPEGPRRLRWVGRRACDARVQPEARPVRIEAGALASLLGARLPTADLLVSPQHALLLRGVLVPAVALVGAPGIGRESPESIVYFHLGLAPHAAVFAEGVPTETFLPVAADGFDAEWGRRPLPGPSFAPRVSGGAALAALRRVLLPRLRRPAAPGKLRGHVERATALPGATRLEGWALDDAAPLRPVRLDVLRDGRRVGTAVANRWRPDLDRAGLAGGSCAFELNLPGSGPFRLCRHGDGALLPALTS